MVFQKILLMERIYCIRYQKTSLCASTVSTHLCFNCFFYCSCHYVKQNQYSLILRSSQAIPDSVPPYKDAMSNTNKNTQALTGECTCRNTKRHHIFLWHFKKPC